MTDETRVTWLYLKSEPQLYTVGFYDPAGKWQPESDHATADEAANRVRFLNGGAAPGILSSVGDMVAVAKMREALEAYFEAEKPVDGHVYASGKRRDEARRKMRAALEAAKAAGL